MKNHKGFFITLEGPEGCGKSTQARRLAQWLEKESYPVWLTKEPGEGEIGAQIRRIILSPENTALAPMTEAILYAADRRQHVEEFLEPALAVGKIVICDRYADSYLAYQGYGRGLDKEILVSLNELAAGGLEPDVTFLLALPPEKGLLRVGGRGNGTDRMERQDRDFHRRVYEGYLAIAAEHPERVVVIAGDGTEEEVFASIRNELKKRIKEYE